jgi:hypothetical protein
VSFASFNCHGVFREALLIRTTWLSSLSHCFSSIIVLQLLCACVRSLNKIDTLQSIQFGPSPVIAPWQLQFGISQTIARCKWHCLSLVCLHVDRHVSRFCVSLQICVRTVVQFQHVLSLYLPMRQVFILRSTIKNLQNIGYDSQSTSVGCYNWLFTDNQGVHLNVSLSTAVLSHGKPAPIGTSRGTLLWRPASPSMTSFRRLNRSSLFRSPLCWCYRTKIVVKICSITAILTTTALVLYRTLDIWVKCLARSAVVHLWRSEGLLFIWAGVRLRLSVHRGMAWHWR